LEKINSLIFNTSGRPVIGVEGGAEQVPWLVGLSEVNEVP
jgi:hypothetical protein